MLVPIRNLPCLRSLPLDLVKVDRALVHDVTGAPQDVSIDWTEPYAARFKAAMDEDFGTPEAVAVLFDLAGDVNRTHSAHLSGVLKALGARTRTLVAMVLVQALIVGVIGFGIGAGAAGAFTITTRKLESELSAYLPWQLLLGSFGATLLTIGLGSLLSIRRVIKVPPGLVFGGT